MPQLNPDPWFLVLMMSWLTYLILLLSLNNLKMINPLIKNNKFMSSPWKWPWI